MILARAVDLLGQRREVVGRGGEDASNHGHEQLGMQDVGWIGDPRSPEEKEGISKYG